MLNQKGFAPIVIILGVFLVVLIGGGALYFQGSSNRVETEFVKEAVNPSSPSIPSLPDTTPPPSELEAKDSYTIMNLSSWKETTGGSRKLYNPSSMKKVTGFRYGPDGVNLPTEYVTISVYSGNETAKQYVDKYLLNNPAYTGVDPKRTSFTLNSYLAEEYKDSGEGSMGEFNIVTSNGNKIVVLTIPSAYSESTASIKQILSTFKLTNQKQTTGVIALNLDKQITFNIPEGWKKEVKFNEDSKDSRIVITSPDYEQVASNSWPGLRIDINKENAHSYDKRYQEIYNIVHNPNPDGAPYQNLKKVTIAGYKALSYDYLFEGSMNYFELWNGDDVWQVVVTSSNGVATTKYKSEINSILSSIKFSN